MPIDLSRLGPGDAVAALRSYPRRFRSAFAPVDDDESVEEIAQRMGPDGESALDVATDLVRTWTVLREALRRIQVDDEPVVHAGVVDPSERHWDQPPHGSVVAVLDQLDEAASQVADAVAGVPGDQWERAGRVAGGGTVTALDVAREAVQVGHDALGAAERTLAAVRR